MRLSAVKTERWTARTAERPSAGSTKRFSWRSASVGELLLERLSAGETERWRGRALEKRSLAQEWASAGLSG